MTRVLVAAVVAAALLGAASPASGAPDLRWGRCPDAADFECATFPVPRDHARPGNGRLDLAVTRLRARGPRIGSLFVNFGGPGGANVTTLQHNGRELFARLNRRFDLVSFDPRGTGASRPAVDCGVDQEHAGPFAQPFMTPATLDVAAMVAADRTYLERCRARNRGLLPHVSTADVARDLDLLRRAVGDRQLSYLGLSYGTYLGATYASLFPRSSGALVLEGANDPHRFANAPMRLRAGLAAAQEHALDRFLAACARDQASCAHFGGADPWGALDALIAQLRRAPLPVGERTADADDLLVALAGGLHAKRRWPTLARALVAAGRGDGRAVRELADGFYGRRPDGGYRPMLDQFFAVSAADARNLHGLVPYLAAGALAPSATPHSYWWNGYGEHLWGLDRTSAPGAFHGPFRARPGGPGVLVVGTTHDPATPYEDAVRLTAQLGNARLLTLDGDGHGAYGGESRCIDAAVDAYLLRGVMPPRNTRCPQDHHAPDGRGGARAAELGSLGALREEP